MAQSVYDIIKKQNGEGFARVLRDKSLLDIPNIAHIVKYAGHNAASAEEIFPYLWSLKGFQEKDIATPAAPFKLLDQAGYHAFEVHNLDEQNSIKHFFRKGEELCTFRDAERYQDNYMIHAIKHEVWRDPYAIQPSKNPARQDEYGTSVISIQIRKSGGFISIKNRYNHTVENPDQTFHSNPDEIIAGLSVALKAYFDVDWKSTGIMLSDGFILFNDQILKINFEINNCYFGDGFYTQGGEIIDIDKSTQVQMDCLIWDNKQKKLLNPLGVNDDFVRIFNEFVQGKKVSIDGKAPNQTITVNGEKIIKLTNNQITTLNLPMLQQCGTSFLSRNTALTELNLPRLQQCGHAFLHDNHALKELNLPMLQQCGSSFLFRNTALTKLNLPRLQQCGEWFLHDNHALEKLNLPRLQQCGTWFLFRNTALEKLDLPMLELCGDGFLHDNTTLKHLYVPRLAKLPDDFLKNNKNVVITQYQVNTQTKPQKNTPGADKSPEHGNTAQQFKHSRQDILASSLDLKKWSQKNPEHDR